MALADTVNLLSKHHLEQGKYYACTCGDKVYSPVTRSPQNKKDAVARHDLHVAEVLHAEGTTAAPEDPRARFLEERGL